jgi:DNA repair exonuclease SbcCD ATPase subunit
MQDRFATAWELSCSERRAEPATSSTLARLQSDDASAHATSVDMREAFPARPRSDLLVLLPSLAVLAATVWLPDLPLFWSESRRKEMNQVAARATHLAKLADQAEKTASKGRLPETRKAASAARRLSSDMKRGMGKKEALVRLNKLTQRLEAQQRRLAAATAGAGKPLASAAMAAQKALQEKPTDAGAGKSGMPRPSQSMDKAQSALKDFAGAVGSRDFEGQNKALQKLADELASGGMSAQELGKLGAQLEQLAKALKGTELDKASQELAELAKQLKAFALDPKTLKDLEKLTAQLRELAKDPEFLKKLAKLAKQAGGT